jgi:hypothetical protein
MRLKSRRIRWVGAVSVALAAVVLYLTLAAPSGPRSLRVFDPDRLAALEIDMWRAYYAGENVRLFGDLVVSLHEQNRYPWMKASIVAFHLARAAATFAKARDHYERVLPDLEAAYAIERDWLQAGFDPATVARAELAWWVARRMPGQNSADQIGALIADEDALLYEVPRERVLPAALLRARAARLRDEGGERVDWPAVSDLLVQSYRSLHAALQ